MWTIRRVRLDHVGTTSARFLDVTLDLTSPVNGLPVDTILWLRNGGGKTTIIALVGALLRPRRDEFLSGDGPRDGAKHLEDYVLGPDTAHVVVEWGETDGRRLVTGAVYEWTDRQQPADPNRDFERLNAGYYAFSPLPGRLELERLPGAANELRLTLDAFLTQLRPFSSATDLVVTRKQSEWQKALDDRALDTDLWRTILAMNKTEGGIEHQFLYSTPADFVRELFRLIVPPEEPEGVADLLRRVAAKLVRRPDLLEELRFAREAVERLTELDVGYRADADARALQAIADEQARDLRASLRLGEDVARMTADAAEGERAAAAASSRDHEREAEGARGGYNEYRRLAAIFRRAAAEIEVKAVADRLASARSTVEAWTVAPSVAVHDAAAERERTLSAALAAATADAEPERIAYLAEAGHLGLLLARLADDADGAVRASDAARTAAGTDITAAARALEAATSRRATLEARAAELTRLHRALDDELGRARADGILHGAETAVAAAARARADDEAAAAAEAGGRADVARLDDEIAAIAETRAIARAALAESRAGLGAATGVKADLDGRVAALAAEARLGELLGVDELDPLGMASNLLAALRDAVGRAGRELVDLGVAGAEDERALAALDSDEGLLPPSLDLARALDALAAAKIPAVAGWSYLARLPAERRTATFLAAPNLVGGALVAAAADLPRARELLAEAGVAPTSIIGLGSTADLDAAASNGGADGPFIVPVSRALYDRDRARDERSLRDGSRGARSAQRAALETRQDGDRALVARIERLALDYPAERVAGLAERIERLGSEVTRLEAAIASGTTALAARTEERTAAARAAAAAAARRLTLARTIARLDGLALREARATETRDEAAGLAERVTAERKAEDAARSAQAEAQGRSDAALRRGIEMAELARTYRGALAELPAERTTPVTPDRRSLDALGAATRAARERYEARTSGSPLARAIEAARDERGRFARDLDAKPAAVVAAARLLIGTADGGDPVARDRALRTASAAAEQLATAAGLARAEANEADAEIERFTPPDDRERHRTLEREPADRAEALALGEEQRLAAERFNRLVLEDDARAEDAKHRFTGADRRAERLHDIARRIRQPEDETPLPVEPWTGSPDAAGLRADELLRDNAGAEAEVARTRAALENLRARILTWSGGFPTVPAEVTSRFRSEGVTDELGPDARAWAGRLGLRADELEADLASLEEHRTNVVTRAMGMVTEALGDLERFSRLSELPDELGEWGGRHFIEVRVRSAVDRSDPVMRDRIGREVDRIVDGRTEPRGYEFLWRSVVAVVGDTGFTARVLKPSPTYGAERVSIEAMRKWSGGEKLTAALLLYVVVAKLRARNRGRRASGAGVLILDNPLGKANYVPFLALQRAVARAAGVQLVFLTGVGDMRAVALFPRIARLRNTSHRGRDYVTLEKYDNDPDGPPSGVLSVTHAARIADPLPLGLD